ncbi:hypothetical protein [Streptomyces sp. ST2-7A]|uniref:hypothetical protein n=1 Tax=Streptomyces sp. ST2-7A TaxID=2907214 RepID=UPI001F3F0859|nr:hypothetical protein [Streptomyces sp. ST2-7A]MCE7081766.1 hypothetical protein [Streptomyces sp. ST2-7A]
MENHPSDPTVFVPGKGELVVDTRQRIPGRVVDMWNGGAWLRPVAGGREWEARVEHLRRPDTTEAIRARMAELDHHSRAGRLR